MLAIVEDLNWSDDTSYAALLHITRRVAGSPLRLLLTYRDNYDRLARIMAAYDPGNLFRVNQNIAPRA